MTDFGSRYVMKLESRISLMEQRLRKQSSMAETREDAIQSDNSNETVLSDRNNIEHHSRLRGDQSANAVDRRALPDPPAGYSGESSVDAAVQTPQQRSTISLLMGGQFNEDVISDSTFDCHHAGATLPDITHLEEPLMQILIDFFYQSIYTIFPIIPGRRFRQQYDLWYLAEKDHNSRADSDFQPLLYALLAVSASIIPEDRAAFARSDFEVYTWLDLADQLYQHAISLSTGKSYQQSPSAAVNTIAAQGLLSLYLIERGKVNDAWVTAGHAIRLYQGLDLQESVNFAREAKELHLAHRNLWWCLYILDRSLSTALLKPLAIDDADSDLESCDEEDDIASSTAAKEDPWFSVIADFHITMGRIYRSVRLIQKAESSQNAKLMDTIRSSVKRHDAELEKYYTKQVLPKIGTPNPQVGPLALQTIAVSSYYIGLVLLYRTFIERFNIAEPEALLRCAEAASNCIKVTPQVIAHVPASHFVIQQSRAIFAGTKVLLHCMRLARNPKFTKMAWSDVESGLKMLREVKIQWPEIKKYQLLTEEDMRLTQNQLTKDDLFYKTFELFGYKACTVGAGERATTQGRYPREALDTSLDSRSLEQSSWGLSNVGTDDSLANDYAESPASLKNGRLDEPSQRQSKRRKLFRPSSPRLAPESDPNAVEMLSMPRGSTDFPITDHMMTTGDLLLPDIIPHQTHPHEFPASFFGDAMLMSSIDQFFLQEDA